MDAFTSSQAHPAGGHRHYSAQGFCTVCGTAWPCWRGLREGTGREAVRSASPLVARVFSLGTPSAA
jgi:hypothetical protein